MDSITIADKDIMPINDCDINNKIYDCIKHKKNWVYKAGAGAGKTYALIETLKYIINSYGYEYNLHKQRVLCITYTNAAVNEIKNRLQNTSLVYVSTIHEYLWDTIKRYQNELVELHKQLIIDKIKDNKETLTKYTIYTTMNDIEKQRFYENINQNEFKDGYYRVYSSGAKEFKEAMANQNISDSLLSNISNFKTIVNSLYSIDKLNNALQQIEHKEKVKIEYDSRFNNDVLHKFKISHETVLFYAHELIKKYNVLKQVICSQYPIILVDEYQDTNDLVVCILKTLSDYGNQNRTYAIGIGFYGDDYQNIYNDGIGSRLTKIFNGIETITNVYNRRSAKNIIQIANNIRLDDMKQIPINQEMINGNAEYIAVEQENIDEIINSFKKRHGINETFYCFISTNKKVAEYNNFIYLYNIFSKCPIYKNSRYEQLNIDLLSNDISKLGVVQKVLYNLMNLISKIRCNESISIYELFEKKIPDNINEEFTINNLKHFINIINNIKNELANNETLKDLLELIFSLISAEKNQIFSELIHTTIRKRNMYNFKRFIEEELCKQEQNNNNDNDCNEIINNLLNTPIKTLLAWYDYIIQNYGNKNIVYQTIHSTKGLEFDNVIIILEDNFGKEKEYFKKLICSYNTLPINTEENIKARNLLYVAVTRAKINLLLVYRCDANREIIDNSLRNIFCIQN